MSRVCGYLVNEHPFYLNMVLNSVRMLRTHNTRLPVVVFLIEDGAEATVRRGHNMPGKMTPDEFESGCRPLGVEVRRRPKRPGHLFLSRFYFSELEQPSVLHMDADTFIFGDVEVLFDRYPTGIAASYSAFIESINYPSPPGFRPINSGVMVMNDRVGQKWAEELPSVMDAMGRPGHPLYEWSISRGGVMEEPATNYFVSTSGGLISYLTDAECRLLLVQEDVYDAVETAGTSLILHTYSPQWEFIYRRLNKIEQRRGIRPRLVKSAV
jgi:hypothetical protein